MKRRIALLIVLMLCLCFAGCGSKKELEAVETADVAEEENSVYDKSVEETKEDVVKKEDEEVTKTATEPIYVEKKFNDIILTYNSNYQIGDEDNSSFNLIFENQKAFIIVLSMDFTNEMSLTDDLVNYLAKSAFLSSIKYEDLVEEETIINGISGIKATCRYLDYGVNADMRFSVISQSGKAYIISIICTDGIEKKDIYDSEYDALLKSVEFVDIIDNVESSYNASDSSKTEEESDEKSATAGQTNALRKAHDYLDFSSFSHKGLIDQLKYEKFTDDEATYAADNCGADWNEQAVKKAKDYLDMMGFSKEGLIDQLIYDGFTREQATYGAESNGI